MAMFRRYSDSWLILAGVCLLGAVLTAGCSDTTSAGADASGIVTLDGQPVANALVSFVPTSGSSAFGTTGSDGRFTVRTSASETGMAAGEYAVSVVPGDSDESGGSDESGDSDRSEEPEEGEGGPAPEAVKKGFPAKYQNERTSGITVTATESGPNEFKIELTSTE